MKLSLLSIALGVTLLAASCSSDKSKKIPDVTGVDIDWSLVRFEKEMLALDTTGGIADAGILFREHPAFATLYFRDIMGFRTSPDSLPLAAGELIAQPLFRHWLDTCHQLFRDFSPWEEELQLSFKLLRHYFPERTAPAVYTLVSEFSIGNFIFQDESGRDAIGIGLDFFLGPQFPYYLMASEFPAFSQYLSRSFTPDHLTRKAMAVIADDLVGDSPPSNLLGSMVEEGKKMYVLEKLVPFVHDTVLWEYTPEQWEWVRDNEGQIWRHLVQEDLLYNTERSLINKLTLAGPNSPGMPLEAPGRTAVYTGYRIVKSFHARNPNMSLGDIIAIRDPQEMLTGSKYRPG